MMSANERPCPVCGGTDYALFSGEKLDHGRITDMTYASRKEPEFMHLRLVKCSRCDLVYAATPPDENYLGAVYSDAAYDSGEEAAFATKTYSDAMSQYLGRIKNKRDAIDVGAGNGALLPLLKAHGFANVVGIEPSLSAISSAPEETRACLRQGLFTEEIISDLRPSLICSFMTLEHMQSPGNFLKSAYDSLDKGGLCAVILHNYRGMLNRILGSRSPIMDIEHLQLFCPKAIEFLMKDTGFEIITIQSLKNTYPLRYWLRLTPVPSWFKRGMIRIFDALRISRVPLGFRVGNLLAIGEKPM